MAAAVAFGDCAARFLRHARLPPKPYGENAGGPYDVDPDPAAADLVWGGGNGAQGGAFCKNVGDYGELWGKVVK